MSWKIRLNGMEFDSDDFLIDDLAEIEKVTEVPWAIANPLREIKVARAFLATAMIRDGKSGAEVEAALRLLTLRNLKKAFEFTADQGAEGEHEESDPPKPKSSSSQGSSSGERPTTGRRLKSADSA